MLHSKDVHQKLTAHKDPIKAKLLSGFFKTGKGQYGEGDVFYGITVPQSRKIAKEFFTLAFDEIKKLLDSPVHESRLIALIILVHQFEKGTEIQKEKVYNFYLQNTKHINNWDLVDTSAHKIVGEYLLDKDVSILTTLAHSQNLWERRIAIVATAAFIRKNKFQPTFDIATILLHDKHDLIHKAVGWMLREVGKRDQVIEEAFLDKHAHKMPRTMLRYAIEKFSPLKRKYYLHLK